MSEMSAMHTPNPSQQAISPEQGAFRALSDPTRRQILLHLAQADLTIAEVANRFDVTRGAIKKHLVILEQGRLISVHANGRERVNRLEPAGMKAAHDWLSHFGRFWDNKLAALSKAIESSTTKPEGNDDG